MESAVGIWMQFLACAAMIGLAGPHLSRSSDIIAEKTGLSSSWIGLMLLATVTSLPELATGISAVTVANAPNIAVGDVLGSCVFNLAILVVLDFFLKGEPVYRHARRGHILSASFGVILIGTAGIGVLLGTSDAFPAIGHVGVSSLVFIALYVLAVRIVFLYERDHLERSSEAVAERYPDVTLRLALYRYFAAAAVILAAGAWLPFVGSELADLMGWNKTFVGTLFVAGATSLPELVVTLAAMRIGALDMAIAGLLGSNLFDILILAIDDMFYTPGPILAQVSPTHAVSAFSAVVMTGVFIVGLQYRPKSKLRGTIGWASLAIFTVYLLNTYVLYLYGH